MNTEEILMVDDERAIRLAVRTALTREGMHVTEAADGSTALDLLKQKHFDLVILDVMMEMSAAIRYYRLCGLGEIIHR